MHLNSPAIVLDVPATAASSEFLIRHLGFGITAQGKGFIALGHKDHGMRIIFRPLAPGQTATAIDRLQIGFLVSCIDSVWQDLKDRATVTDPIRTVDATHERSFQIVDANGIAYRLIEFV